MEDRSLHLLDVEYLGCGPTLSATDLALVMRVYRRRTAWHVGDLVVGAASTWVYRQIAFDAPTDIRLLNAGSGPDAADLCLIDEARDTDLTRFERVVIASGDHRFTGLAHHAHRLGIVVVAAGYSFNMASRLRRAVDDVVVLDGFHLAA